MTYAQHLQFIRTRYLRGRVMTVGRDGDGDPGNAYRRRWVGHLVAGVRARYPGRLVSRG